MQRLLLATVAIALAAPASAQILSADPALARSAEAINRTNNDLARTEAEAASSPARSIISGGMSRSQRMRAAKRAEERKAKHDAERAAEGGPEN